MSGELRAGAAAFAVFGVLCIAGMAHAQDPATQEGLVPAPNARAELAYVRPDADWGKYRTIMIMPLHVPAEARDASGGQRTQGFESFVLQDRDVRELAERFDRVLREELTRGGRYTIVETAGEDTLVIAASILRLVLAAPIERTRRAYSSSGGVFTGGSGAATFSATFADGADYTVLARVVDNRYDDNDMWQLNTRARNLHNLDQMYAAVGREIRDRLEELQTSGGAGAP